MEAMEKTEKTRRASMPRSMATRVMQLTLLAAAVTRLPAACWAQNPPISAVSVREADDYVFGGYQGEFQSPPSADGNPRRAVIVEWAGKPWRLVFSHDASYCPFIELSD